MQFHLSDSIHADHKPRGVARSVEEDHAAKAQLVHGSHNERASTASRKRSRPTFGNRHGSRYNKQPPALVESESDLETESSSNNSPHFKVRQGHAHKMYTYDKYRSLVRSKSARSSDLEDDDAQLGVDDSEEVDSRPASSSESESATDSSEESFSSEDSRDGPQTKKRGSLTQRSSRGRAIFFRAGTNIADDELTAIQQRLQSADPAAEVFVDQYVKRSETYASRAAFTELMNRVMDGTIAEIMVPDSTHLCSTKDAFNLLWWICKQYGTRVLIEPALETA